MDQFKDWSTKIAINYDSDSFDRLRYIYTNYFILGVAFFVFSKSYVGEAVQCWVPAQFQGGWESYVENYCLIENTYFSRFNATRLPPKEDREKLEMLYYQWVPFILCGIALSLYAPRVIWKLLHGALGGGETLKKNLKKLRTAAKNFETADDVLLLRTEGRAGNKQFLGARLTFALLFCKALALLVLVANLCYLNYILGNEFHRFWGVSVFWDLLKGHEWHSSGNFPRVTFCDVEVRELGSINRWTLQCVLMVNMFNEKVFSPLEIDENLQFFLLLWIWFLVLLVLGVANLFLWLFRSFSASSRNSFVRSLLVMSGEESATLNDAEYLVDRRLGLDGVSLLRLAATNSTDFVAARQLVLWKEEQGNGEQKDSKG